MSPAVEEAVFRVSWEAALAELELEVDAAERLLAAVRAGASNDLPTGLGSWEQPAGLSPLPESMVERAQIVLDRQLRVVGDLAHAAVRSRQHLEVQRRMRPDDAVARPMFVDAAF